MAIRALFVILLIIGSGLYGRSMSSHRAMSPGIPPLATIPGELTEWRSVDFDLGDQVEDVLRADAYVMRQYGTRSGASINLFVAYFADQEVGSQIHSPRNCLPGSGWNILSIEPTEVKVPGGIQKANLMTAERSGRRQEVLYWFQTRGGTITGEYALKLDLVNNSLRRRPTDAVFVRFMGDREQGDALRGLIADLHAPLREVLATVGLP